MKQTTISAIVDVSAPADVVYGILADYHDGHPRILPKSSFGELIVESGGRGAGTVFSVRSRQLTGMKTFRMRVSEPQPGRVLVESDLDSDLATTFIVEPVDGGKRCRVTIETRWTRGGVGGWIERMLLPVLARSVFVQEIRNLEALARERSSAAPE